MRNRVNCKGRGGLKEGEGPERKGNGIKGDFITFADNFSIHYHNGNIFWFIDCSSVYGQ